MKTFKDLTQIDVKPFIEKNDSKGDGRLSLSYLSWAVAVDFLLKEDNDANWHYKEPVIYKDGSMMVFCCVTAFGKERCCHLPVLDFRNKAIVNPNSFQVNYAMQRCLVKAIALHGIGLNIYKGEDIDAIEQMISAPKYQVNKTVTKQLFPATESQVLTLRQIIDELGTSESTIKNWCIKEGVETIEEMSEVVIQKYIDVGLKKLESS